MSDETQPRDKSRSKRRRKPPKRAWYEHPWLLPGIGVACALMLVVVSVAWWRQRAEAPASEQVQAANGSLQENLQDVYKGDYTLLDPNTLQQKDMLPTGLQMRKDANELVSPWGRMELMGANAQGRTQAPYTHYLLIYYTVPQKDCAQLAQQMLARYGQVWIGQSAPLPNPKEHVANVGEIASRCTSTTSAVMSLGR